MGGVAEKQNLNELGDVTSGMASTVIQILFQSIFDSFVHPSVEVNTSAARREFTFLFESQVRHVALKAIQLFLAQGLVHPVQVQHQPLLVLCFCQTMLGFFIASIKVRNCRLGPRADQTDEMVLIHMKLMKGIMLSFRLQQLLQKADGEQLVLPCTVC